jgi:hypothetical protein
MIDLSGFDQRKKEAGWQIFWVFPELRQAVWEELF